LSIAYKEIKESKSVFFSEFDIGDVIRCQLKENKYNEKTDPITVIKEIGKSKRITFSEFQEGDWIRCELIENVLEQKTNHTVATNEVRG